jgi:ribosome-binding factor A
LERANGFLRRALAAVIDMRHCPNLIFSYDNSISEGARMSALIDKALNNKD